MRIPRAPKQKQLPRPQRPLQFRLALNGEEPAEALTAHDRRLIIARLHRRGWTDLEIAVLTRTTTYTTARIRHAIGLRPNRPRTAEELSA